VRFEVEVGVWAGCSSGKELRAVVQPTSWDIGILLKVLVAGTEQTRKPTR
jgi:hypothetical protein